MRLNLRAGIVLIATLLAIPAARASGIDLHWLWDDRCATCHGHAGDFARKFLAQSCRSGVSLRFAPGTALLQ
jgi:hypothetical protein